jgi:hypothetical protein
MPAIEKAKKINFNLPLRQSKLCPMTLLHLDLNNPRLQTGGDISAVDEEAVILALADIAALDELVTSICTNDYLNLEPLIVIGQSDAGPFRVLEGNRRLAAIKLISDRRLAKEIGVKLPNTIRPEVMSSIKNILVYRVEYEEEARAFIGFKHINGPQRWDAYAKARYVTDWYKGSKGKISISEIADKMGDNNNTLRAYIYSLLILEQAEEDKVWFIKDRSNVGRFGFSHFYTAIGRKEYQEFLGLTDGWSDTPPMKPLDKSKLSNLGEVLSYIYGSKSDDRLPILKSQNPDLKDIGLAIVHPEARQILRNRGSLDEARDALKSPSEAFYDALTMVNLKIARAIKLMPKYDGGRTEIDELVDEIYEQADTLKTMNDKKKLRKTLSNVNQ